MEILSGNSRYNAVTVRTSGNAMACATDSVAHPSTDSVTLNDTTKEPSESKTPNGIARLMARTPNWRDVTLNEAVVEIPQGILQLSNLNQTHPGINTVAQAGVSTLAFMRAYQGLRGNSLEQKMEGASSLILGVAGTISMFPGSLAASASNHLMMGQGAIELSLGVRELHEELVKKQKPHWQEVVTGSLDVIKGGSSFLPLIDPTLNTVSNAIQLGALVSKTVLEATFHHDPEKKA